MALAAKTEAKVYYDKDPLYLIGPRHAFEQDDLVTIYPKRLKGESIEVIVHRENPGFKDGIVEAYTVDYYEERFGEDIPF